MNQWHYCIQRLSDILYCPNQPIARNTLAQYSHALKILKMQKTPMTPSTADSLAQAHGPCPMQEHLDSFELARSRLHFILDHGLLVCTGVSLGDSLDQLLQDIRGVLFRHHHFHNVEALALLQLLARQDLL